MLVKKSILQNDCTEKMPHLFSIFCHHYDRKFREFCLMHVPDLLSGYVKHSADTLKTWQPSWAQNKNNKNNKYSSLGFCIALTVLKLDIGRIPTSICLILSMDPFPLHGQGI